jgi:probable rRNA maturation factor
MPRFTLVNRQRRIPLNTTWLRRVAKMALPICRDISDDGRFALRDLPEVVVAIVSDPVISQIHVDFMGIEGPTDVITFDHGEIVISADTAKIYAARYSHTIEQELALYTVHGLLHLNGFDDLSPAPAARMRKTQARILRQVLAKIPQSPDSRT